MIRDLAASVLGAINAPFGLFGVQLVRSRMAEAEFSRRIRALARAGFSPSVIVDGGAFSGNWSLDVHRVFPRAQLVVIEPNPEMMTVCERKLGTHHPRPCFERCALGPAPGRATLKLWSGSAGSAASLLEHVSGPPSRAVDVEVRTMDGILESLGLRPDLVKLDLQGFELPALQGAQRALASAEAVIVEISCLGAYVDRSSARSIFDFMYDHGFELHDIADLGYRPMDGALAGADLTFVRSTSPLRAKSGYR